CARRKASALNFGDRFDVW
nr:immunoglobulin heavy chain junction region [Macaca mulatta]MOW98974.1 immunoglobulin heavy chain junction region [Macaca mulatta]MOX01795.1 immunoglobulin heavy chain junction region [Macaca mulatta]MOX03346.1 immunoglobulin heavy chain junction region [Macaca mulatta]MOX04793.1 immunoglobulin heavy chain junction region [Macaca mulatta]